MSYDSAQYSKLLKCSAEKIIGLVNKCHKEKRVRRHVQQSILFRWNGSDVDYKELIKAWGPIKALREFATSDEIANALSAIGFSPKYVEGARLAVKANEGKKKANRGKMIGGKGSVSYTRRPFDYLYGRAKDRINRGLNMIEYRVNLY